MRASSGIRTRRRPPRRVSWRSAAVEPRRERAKRKRRGTGPTRSRASDPADTGADGPCSVSRRTSTPVRGRAVSSVGIGEDGASVRLPALSRTTTVNA